MNRIRTFAIKLTSCLLPAVAGCALALPLAVSIFLPGGAAGDAHPEATISELPVMTERRLELTREYCREHYGLDSYELAAPRIIVVHYTAFPTMRQSYEFFRASVLQPDRSDIRSGGRVNVTAHYLVDKNGVIYRLAPESVICRHTIGFNHLALGIENVGTDSSSLTDAQLKADAELISGMIKRHPTIDHLIGHHEYMESSLPHFSLFRELNHGYRPTVKHDPGPVFMKRLRSLLIDKYGIRLLD